MRLRTGVVSLLALAGAFSAWAPPAGAAESGCLKCHGDPKVMNALVKPPTGVSAEGEG